MDIRKLAEKAGINHRIDEYIAQPRELEEFARLVASEERERIIRFLAESEFTSLDHMPHEAATLLRAECY
jgi:MoaA/NifB/PqqE/SkfB family radical SAM enzyme